MKGRKSFVCVAVGTLLLGVATPSAHAQNADGFALNRFDPAERGSDWFWAESLDLRGHNRLAVGMTGDWAYKPLVVYNEEGNEVAALVEHQVYAHFGASYLLLDRLRFGVQLPVLAFQQGDDVRLDGVAYSAPSAGAIGDVRLGADLRLFGEYGGPITAALGAQLYFPTGRTKQFTGDGSTRLAPRFAIAGDVGLFTYAVRTGVMVRFAGEDFGEQAVGTEWTFGGAAGIRLVDKKLTVGPEIWGATVIADGSNGLFSRDATPVEGILGAHYRVLDRWMLGAGIGPGFSRGLGAPQLRTLLSLDWAPLPKHAPPAPADADGDGIRDPDDACPDQPGQSSTERNRNGCPAPEDTDRDGIIDDLDACPDVSGVSSDEAVKNGCPLPVDTDGDGIFDPEDACPQEAGPTSEDSSKHGCPLPEVDTDGDGIFDEQDACAEIKGVASTNPEENGCPRARIEAGQVKILERVEFGSANTSFEGSVAALEAVLAVLQEHPEITKVRVEGHTDSTGRRSFNLQLSRERADAVVSWLVDHGIDATRLVAVGLGPDKPIDSSNTDEGRRNNRRVEFHIIEGEDLTTNDASR